MKLKAKSTLLILSTSFLLFGCGNTPVEPPVVPVVTGVTVSPSSITIDLSTSDSFDVTAVVEGTNNPSQDVTWTIDSNIASINQNGHVSCFATGEARITATSVANPSFSGYCDLTIAESVDVIDATKIYTTSNVSTFALNGTRTIKTVLYPNNAKKNVKFISSDTDILSPDENGVVTGVGLGTATIVAYNDNNENNQLDEGEPKTHVVYTIVNTDTSKSISLPEEEQEVTIEVDEILQFHPVLNGTFSYISGYSDNEEVCEVFCDNTNGRVVSQKIRGLKPGTSTVSLYNGSYQGATCRVTVVDKEDSSGKRASHIETKRSVINMVVGETKNLVKDYDYTIYPSDTVDTLTSVDSSDISVATANYRRITALKAGSVTLTYSTSNGKSVKQRVVVTDPSISQTETFYDDYYGDLTWENGADLKQKLHDIIDDNATLIYDGNWDSNRAADQDLYNYSEVDALYTSSNYLKTEQNTKWNREHSIPATKMTALNTGATNYVGRATDFHNLFAADKDDNSSHGNRDFGFTDPTSLGYVQREDCSRQGDIFEPEQDEDKGKLARAIMYMAVRYNEVTPLSFTEKNSKDQNVSFTVNQAPVELVDDIVGYNRFKFSDFDTPSGEGAVMYANYLIDEVRAEPDNSEATEDELKALAYTKYLEDYSPYSAGNLKDLLMWNTFPVTLGEYQHNESVYTKVVPAKEEGSTVQKAQGNRNPFVDYPELAEYVFGSLQNQPGSLKNLIPSYLALEMNKDELHHYAFTGETPSFEVGDELDVTKLNIKAIKNDLSEMTLDPTDLSVEPHTFTEDDVASGYIANVTTSKNNLSITVKVNSDAPGADVTFDECTYHFETSTKPQDLLVDGTATFGDLQWTYESQNSVSYASSNGLKIGAANAGAGTFTLITKDSLNSINHFFMKIYVPKELDYTYDLFVGDTQVVDSASLRRETAGFVDPMPESLVNSLTGKVKIVLKGLTSYISLKGIAINYTK